MRHYCTYFDERFLPRALALYASLRRHARPFRLWTLALDRRCRDTLERLALPEVAVLGWDELEAFDPELRRVKPARTPLEYALTCTPVLPLYVLSRDAGIGLVTYLDADLGFFSDPEPLFAEAATGSIAITPHRFPEALRHWERTAGRYNDGWVTFRRDAAGLACLRWWRERCLEWCHNRREGGRFTEQAYLDRWPELFDGVVELRHPGANVGPWNLGGVDLSLEGGRVLADGAPLIFFHFSGLRRLLPGLYDLNLADFGVRPSGVARERVFAPYIRELAAAQAGLRRLPRASIAHGGRREEALPPLPLRVRVREGLKSLRAGSWLLVR